MAPFHIIQRCMIILRKIKQSNGIHLAQLKEEVTREFALHGIDNIAVSDSSLKRDIAEIRNNFISIPYSRTRGYYVAEDEAVSKNLENLMESFDILNALNADTGLDHIVFPERQGCRGTEYLYPLLRAIREHRLVSFLYHKFNEASPTERTLAPYALKECRGRWYLLGIERGGTHPKTFGLDRISRLQKEPATFKPRTDIDIPALFRDFFGILIQADRPTEEILLSFSRSDGNYVESLPIHPSQQTLPHPTDPERMMFRLEMKITDEFPLMLISRGASLQVHAPDRLREEVLKVHRDAIEELSK